MSSFGTRDQEMARIRETLRAVSQRAKERLREDAPAISETALLDEYRRNPQQARGFFQALGGTRSPNVLLMVWRIIQGMEVKDVKIEYQRQKSIELTVILESPDGKVDPPYTSRNISDFTLFRHIGVLELSGKPVFDGFYALRLRDT